MRLSILTDVRSVDRLVPAWRQLADGHPASNPFNHPGWVTAWWSQRREPGLVWRCVVGWDGDHLVGLLPLVRYPDGTVRIAGHDLLDIASTLVSKELCARLWSGAAMWLREIDGSTTLDIPVIADDDLKAVRALGLNVRVKEEDPGAYVELPRSWDTYLSTLSAGRMKRMRWERRQLEAHHGPVTFEIITDSDQLISAVESLWQVRERSWRKRQRYDELMPWARGESIKRFLRALVGYGSRGMQPAVSVLRAGENTVAMALLLYGQGAAWYYMCTYAPEYGRYGPGRLLLAECIRAAIGQGLRILDLGRGDESYKFALGAKRRVLANVTIEV
jgi:CelD/BcsL family acetyltransferase involved in cellulose biosynthesis